MIINSVLLLTADWSNHTPSVALPFAQQLMILLVALLIMVSPVLIPSKEKVWFLTDLPEGTKLLVLETSRNHFIAVSMNPDKLLTKDFYGNEMKVTYANAAKVITVNKKYIKEKGNLRVFS